MNIQIYNQVPIGSIDNEKISRTNLSEAVKRHLEKEKASFHTPGHKGRSLSGSLPSADWYALDLTELPGLDDLAHPKGVLADLEARAACIWGAEQSFVSVNGASAGIMAAVLAASTRGKTILVPRNCHRSTVHALILSGLYPIWYEPEWNQDWQFWGIVAPDSLNSLLDRHSTELAAVTIVSPTYAGAISDISQIVKLTKSYDVPLIVDEAHGSHFLPATGMPSSAVSLGADVIVHSMHKTLGALTQTAIIHVNSDSLISPKSVKSCLNLLHTSSPSYLFMLSIEEALANIEGETGVGKLEQMLSLRLELDRALKRVPDVEIYEPQYLSDPASLLIRLKNRSANYLYDFLVRQGIYPETIMGNGVLLFLGIGSSAEHASYLIDVLSEVREVLSDSISKTLPESINELAKPQRCQAPACVEQVISPRQAFLSPAVEVEMHRAAGRIAADCIAPCPPGWPIIVPGQRIPKNIGSLILSSTIRVVDELVLQTKTDTVA